MSWLVPLICSSQLYQGHPDFGEYFQFLFCFFFFKEDLIFCFSAVGSHRYMVTAGTCAQYLKWKLYLSSLMNMRMIVCVSATRHQFKQDLLNRKFIVELIHYREVYCRILCRATRNFLWVTEDSGDFQHAPTWHKSHLLQMQIVIKHGLPLCWNNYYLKE